MPSPSESVNRVPVGDHRAEVIFLPGVGNAVVVGVNEPVIAGEGEGAVGGEGVGLGGGSLVKGDVAELTVYGPGGALVMVVEGAVPDWLTGPARVKVPWPRFLMITMVPPGPQPRR